MPQYFDGSNLQNDLPISKMTPGVTATGTEIVPLLQGGKNRTLTVAQITATVTASAAAAQATANAAVSAAAAAQATANSAQLTANAAVPLESLANPANGLGADLVGGVGRVVNTITALKALLKTGVGKAFVLGYYTMGDGGGGQYWYDSTDVSSTDNGGTIIVATDGGRWKLIYRDYVTPDQFGVIGDGSSHVANAQCFQNCIDWSSPLGVKIILSGKTYVVTPFQAQSGAASYNTAMVMKSGMHIVANHGGMIKISDNYSTNGAPLEMAMFSTVSHISNVTFEGVTMDMNGANNLMSPSRPTTYNQFNHAAIFVNGPTGIADYVTIDSCTFQNTAGVCFVVCQLVAAGTTPTLGHTWKITNSLFINGGSDTNDHTSVFAWGEDILCSGCTFWEDNPPHTTGKTGGATCYEIHGARARFVNNYCYNYTLGLYVSPNFTNITQDVIVAGNHFNTSDYGVLIWRWVTGGVNYLEIDDVLIDGNTFYFSSYTYTGQPSYRAAIAYQGQIASTQATVNNIKITNNVAMNTGTLLSQFVHWDTSTTASQVSANVSITDNIVLNFNDGIYVITNSVGPMGFLNIARNQIIGLSPDATANPAHGIYLNGDPAGPFKTTIIEGNAFIDERGSPLMGYGIYLHSGSVFTDLSIGSNTYKGMANANCFNAGATITRMIGSVFTDVAQASVADGGTITFNGDYAGFTPKAILATGSNAGDIISVTTFSTSTATVAIKKWTGGALTAGSTQTIYLHVKF